MDLDGNEKINEEYTATDSSNVSEPPLDSKYSEIFQNFDINKSECNSNDNGIVNAVHQTHSGELNMEEITSENVKEGSFVKNSFDVTESHSSQNENYMDFKKEFILQFAGNNELNTNECQPEINDTDEINFTNIAATSNNNATNIKSKRKRDDPEGDSKKKRQSVDDKKIINTRKNIRDIIDDKNLDATTLTAQRQESERLARVQEQQRVIREIQKQITNNRQSQQLQSHRSLLKNKTTLSNVENPFINTEIQLSEEKLPHALNDTYIVKGVAQEVTFEGSNFIDVDKIEESNPPLEMEHTDNFKPATIEIKEVVTISDTSESEDECIVLSDDDDEEEIKDEDDPHNSGLHVNDSFNTLDEQGRVIVNIGHPASEPDVFVAPQLARILKPHQIGGIRFLFDNVIESIDRFELSSGFGCILAHSMGLGKTLQIVTFCDIIFRHTNSKTVLCIMPINTLQNWLNEFNKWLPMHSDIHNISSYTGDIRPRNFNVFVLNDQFKTLSSRTKVILQWQKEGGVLLMGYELFRLLSLKSSTTKKKSKVSVTPKKTSARESETHTKLMEDMYAALVQPGPDLVVCDEGHRIKNSHASISVALKQIRTKRRVVLTGYPLQNNLLEYWCMVDFVRPNYLGTKTEFCNMFERPIQNGQCIDSTPNDIKFMRHRAHVLHSLLVGFVQRRSHMVLQNTLPRKQEYVILLRMTPFQRKLYEVFMNDVVRSKAVPNPLKAFAVCCKIWNHPDVLYNFLKAKVVDLDLEVEEQQNSNNSSTNNKKKVNSKDSIIHCDSPKNALQTEPTAIRQTNWLPNRDYFNFENPPANIPDYVGIVVEPVNTSEPNSIDAKAGSSDIVDLDTKEIKTVQTDINLREKHLSSGNTSTLSVEPQANQNGSEAMKNVKDDRVSYEWAKDLLKGYQPDLIENSPKMEVFFCLLKESVQIGDRILVFSQSLLTLNLIEKFLQMNPVPGKEYHWAKNSSYFRIDGSTPAIEREKLITEFNKNPDIHLFLVSTKAGSLGINLVGANRVIVFDASWNPCHDTQAVCRVYRYGQQKPCFIYRIVMDNCLEKKIYDRQINKQGMADRVVDECNPDAHLSLKEVTNLCYDYEKDPEALDFSYCKDKFTDAAVQKLLDQFGTLLSREPFCHESLLVDRKEKKLTQAEKRIAQRSYEMAKKAAAKPTYSIPYRLVKPIDSNVGRPINMVQNGPQVNRLGARSNRWIPADVWQRQGMTAQEMTLPLDVVIPTSSGDKSSLLLKAGQKVMVLKSAKGVYMQLESGKIIAIRTSKLNTNKDLNPFSSTSINANRGDIVKNTKRTGSTDSTKKDGFYRTDDRGSNTSTFTPNENEDSNDDVILISDSADTDTIKSEIKFNRTVHPETIDVAAESNETTTTELSRSPDVNKITTSQSLGSSSGNQENNLTNCLDVDSSFIVNNDTNTAQSHLNQELNSAERPSDINTQYFPKRSMPNIRNIPAPYPSIYTSIMNQKKESREINSTSVNHTSFINIDKPSSSNKYSHDQKIPKSSEIGTEVLYNDQYNASSYFHRQTYPTNSQVNVLHHSPAINKEEHPSPYLEPASHSLHAFAQLPPHSYNSSYDNAGAWYNGEHIKPYANHMYGSYDGAHDAHSPYNNSPHSIASMPNHFMHAIHKPADYTYHRSQIPPSTALPPQHNATNHFPNEFNAPPLQKNQWHQE